MKALPLLSLLAIYLSVNADKISFAYDEAGNRTNRAFTVTAIDKLRGRSAEVVNTYFEQLNSRAIRIWHDTHGKIWIEIADFGSGDEATVSVFSAGGAEVFSTPVSERLTDIDISSKSTGVYLLTVNLNGEQTVWKIIKG